MEQSFKLKYGDADLELTKSTSLIAIRPQPGMAKMMQNELKSMSLSRPTNDYGTLGGFEIVEVGETGEGTEQTLDTLRQSSTVAVGSHVFHTSRDKMSFVPLGTLFLIFKNDISDDDRQSLLDKFSLELIEARSKDDLILRVTPESGNPIKTAVALQQSGLVEVAEPELATPGRLMADSSVIPTDMLLREQWHLKNSGYHRGTNLFFRQGADARVVEAWQAINSLGSPRVVVAVIDDGFDLTHPDLIGKIIYPWDFTRNSDDPSPDPDTDDWHGTACAGVAVGRPGGGDIVGAAPGAALMSVRWGRNLSDSEIEAWFGYVATRGAWVVSCSWGAAAESFPLSTRMKIAIQKCATQGRDGKGCVIVFAAGNSNHDINDPAGGTVDGFAAHPDIISVAASTSRDMRSHYSNFGKEVWVCAPSSGAGGAGIVTSDVTGFIQRGGFRMPLGYAPGDYTFEFGGTSSACPLVAGICALVLSVNPNLTAKEVKTLLKETARKIGDGDGYVDGHSRYFGYGCVNAEEAVKAAAGSLPVA